MDASAAEESTQQKMDMKNYSDEEEEEETYSYAMQVVSMCTLPMVMQSAIELDLFEIIAKAGPGAKLSPTDIATRIPTNRNPEDAPNMLDRILRLLASYSILTCSLQDQDKDKVSTNRVYGLAPVAKYFVRNEDGVSLGPLMSLLQDKVFIDSWYALKDAVENGGVPFNKVHGSHAFDYPSKDQRFNEVFNKAMVSNTSMIIKKILQHYKGFEALQELVDVGGGHGITLNLITSKYPTIKGVNFDLPHVLQHAPLYPGVEHVGGDMFESVPKGEAIFMKWILHDWSDDHCLKLLKNCYKALPDEGKVIVVDAILPIIPDTSAAVKGIYQSDLIMMTQNPGGKERTQQEFLALATAAGFSGVRIECFVCNFGIMEFFK